MSSEGRAPAPEREVEGPFGTARLSTGDAHVDEILDGMANTCMRLEALSLDLDRAQVDLDRALNRSPRDEVQLESLRRHMEETMAEIVLVESVELPGLMRSLQEIGLEKALGGGLAETLRSQLNSVARDSDLVAAEEPIQDAQGRSPWELD